MRAVESVILIGALATVAQMSTGCNNEVERIKKTSDTTLMQDNDGNQNQGYTVTPVGVPASSSVPDATSSAGKTNSLPVHLGDLQDKAERLNVRDKLDKYNTGLQHKVQDVAGSDRVADFTNKWQGKISNFAEQAKTFGATTPPPSLTDILKEKTQKGLGKLAQVASGHTTPKPSNREVAAGLVKDGVGKVGNLLTQFTKERA